MSEAAGAVTDPEVRELALYAALLRDEYVFALGISPFDAHAWVIPKAVLKQPKAVLKQYVIGYMGQHTGADATDTSWLSVKVGEEPEWLADCGGSLAKVRDLLAAMDG